jgi:hypothetical protein
MRYQCDSIQSYFLIVLIGGLRVRMTDPSTYMRVCFSILPRDILLNVTAGASARLTDSLRVFAAMLGVSGLPSKRTGGLP